MSGHFSYTNNAPNYPGIYSSSNSSLYSTPSLDPNRAYPYTATSTNYPYSSTYTSHYPYTATSLDYPYSPTYTSRYLSTTTSLDYPYTSTHTSHYPYTTTSLKYPYSSISIHSTHNQSSQRPKSSHISSKPKSHHHPLSDDDKKRQKTAQENHQYVKDHPEMVSYKVDNIDDQTHRLISTIITKPTPKGTPITVTSYSTIDTAIYYHKHGYSKICVLNFADALKAGGGYLNGRSAQEESLCRQTLLYPTLLKSTMHSRYAASSSIYDHDFMTYSEDVYVIRDNDCQMIGSPFKINVISAPAVDNRKYVSNASHIMERRIREIVKLAAYKKNNVLVLGAFGCGVFKNDTRDVARIFNKVLVKEGLKDFFQLVVFPIYKDESAKRVFENALL